MVDDRWHQSAIRNPKSAISSSGIVESTSSLPGHEFRQFKKRRVTVSNFAKWKRGAALSMVTALMLGALSACGGDATVTPVPAAPAPTAARVAAAADTPTAVMAAETPTAVM